MTELMMKQKLINWLDQNFGSLPSWDDMEWSNPKIGFKTRYGLIWPTEVTPTGSVFYDTQNQRMYVNIGDGKSKPKWRQI